MINQAASELIKQSEGLKLTAYQDSVGKWTIGYGTTYYPDGSPVQQGDIITAAQASEYLQDITDQLQGQIIDSATVKLSPNQTGALVSFAYNLGFGALQGSTLFHKVNTNPQDSTIRDEFNKWIHAGGQVLPGLVERREKEADLYFTGTTQKVLDIALLVATAGVVVGLIFLLKYIFSKL